MNVMTLEVIRQPRCVQFDTITNKLLTCWTCELLRWERQLI